MDTAAIRRRAEACLGDLSNKVAVSRHEVERIDAERRDLEAAQARDRDEAELYAQSIAGLNLLMRQVVGKNLSLLEQDVNDALAAILPEQDLQFKVIPEVKWDKQVYKFAILHDGVPHTDAEGIGGTPLSIVSLVLRVMFIIYTKRYRLLVLDESLRMISRSHKARTSQFVQQLARKLGVHILLVTHDEAFAVAADTNFSVQAVSKKGQPPESALREVTSEEVRAYFQNEAPAWAR